MHRLFQRRLRPQVAQIDACRVHAIAQIAWRRRLQRGRRRRRIDEKADQRILAEALLQPRQVDAVQAGDPQRGRGLAEQHAVHGRQPHEDGDIGQRLRQRGDLVFQLPQLLAAGDQSRVIAGVELVHQCFLVARAATLGHQHAVQQHAGMALQVARAARLLQLGRDDGAAHGDARPQALHADAGLFEAGKTLAVGAQGRGVGLAGGSFLARLPQQQADLEMAVFLRQHGGQVVRRRMHCGDAFAVEACQPRKVAIGMQRARRGEPHFGRGVGGVERYLADRAHGLRRADGRQQLAAILDLQQLLAHPRVHGARQPGKRLQLFGRDAVLGVYRQEQGLDRLPRASQGQLGKAIVWQDHDAKRPAPRRIGFDDGQRLGQQGMTG